MYSFPSIYADGNSHARRERCINLKTEMCVQGRLSKDADGSDPLQALSDSDSDKVSD